MTVHLDNAEFPTFTVTLYRYDGINCIAVVDGTPVAFVSRSQTVNLIEAVNELTLGQKLRKISLQKPFEISVSFGYNNFYSVWRFCVNPVAETSHVFYL